MTDYTYTQLVEKTKHAYRAKADISTEEYHDLHAVIGIYIIRYLQCLITTIGQGKVNVNKRLRVLRAVRARLSKKHDIQIYKLNGYEYIETPIIKKIKSVKPSRKPKKQLERLLSIDGDTPTTPTRNPPAHEQTRQPPWNPFNIKPKGWKPTDTTTPESKVVKISKSPKTTKKSKLATSNMVADKTKPTLEERLRAITKFTRKV